MQHAVICVRVIFKRVCNDRVLPAFPIYEHDGREKVRANDGLTLGDFAWEPDPVDDGKLPISVFRKTTYLYVIAKSFPASCWISRKLRNLCPSSIFWQWKCIYKNTRRDQKIHPRHRNRVSEARLQRQYFSGCSGRRRTHSCLGGMQQ